MNPFQLQMLGILLACLTAMGTLAYNRLVQSCSFSTIGLLASIQYVPWWLCSLYFTQNIRHDLIQLRREKICVALYILSGLICPIFYWITKRKGVLTSSVFEMKYIFILMLFAILVGKQQVSSNTIIGTVLAMASIYFISK